ncbi:MAG TPA: hypothetical protein VF086_20860 [Propionibacteriaceae bacterium]
MLAGWPVPHTEDWISTHLGETFVLNSVDTKQRLEQHAPHATVILFPDAGHLLPTQTDRVHAFLTDTTS